MAPVYVSSITYMSIILLIFSVAQLAAITMVYRLLRSKAAHITAAKQDIKTLEDNQKP